MTLAALLETPEPEVKPEEAGDEKRGSPRYLDFAQLLRQLMETRGLNASQLARAVWGETTDNRGYKVARNRDRIGHYLLGASFPEEGNLRKLAHALECPYEDLAATKPASGPASYAASTTANFGPRRNAIPDVQITLAAHKPKCAFVEIKRWVPTSTMLKMLELLKAVEDEDLNTPADPN